MSPWFGSPQFINALHNDRTRRLRQFSRQRRLVNRGDERRPRS